MSVADSHYLSTAQKAMASGCVFVIETCKDQAAAGTAGFLGFSVTKSWSNLVKTGCGFCVVAPASKPARQGLLSQMVEVIY